MLTGLQGRIKVEGVVKGDSLRLAACCCKKTNRSTFISDCDVIPFILTMRFCLPFPDT